MQLGDIGNADALPFGRPLEGVRVLALEQMQALPYATQLLARLGADVVKIESTKGGDLGRGSQPSITDPEGRTVGATFLRNNLGKRSICVDLKAPEGRQLVLDLAPKFDIVAENFKGGALARMGLGYDDIAAVHPSVVYVSVSGFGNTVGDPVRRLARLRRRGRGDVGHLRLQARARPTACRVAGGRPRRHRHRALRHDRPARRPAPAGPNGRGPVRRRRHVRRHGGHDRSRHQLLVVGSAPRTRPGSGHDPRRLRGHQRLVHHPGRPGARVRAPGQPGGQARVVVRRTTCRPGPAGESTWTTSCAPV